MSRKNKNELVNIIDGFFNRYNKFQFSITSHLENKIIDNDCSFHLWHEKENDWCGLAIQRSIEENKIFPFIQKLFDFKEHDHRSSSYKINDKEIKTLKDLFKEFGYEIEFFKERIGNRKKNHIFLRMLITNETLGQKLIELSDCYKNKIK